MIRATTGGVMRSYRKNLMSSFIASNKARDTVLTQRNFNSYAEDPATAAKAFRLRMSRLTTESQLSICKDTYSKYQTAFGCLLTIDEYIDTENGKGTSMTTIEGTSLEMLNDPKGDARVQLTKVLDQLSDSIVQNLNQKYGDDFIFAGADGQNVPFEVKQVGGKNKLYYRGVPVDAAEPELMKDANGNPIKLGNDYVLADAQTVDPADLPALANDGATPPVNTVVTDGNGTQFYVKQSTTGPEAAPADPTAYTEVTLSDGTTTFYPTSDLVDKSGYDTTMDSLAKDANGNPLTATIDGKTVYVKQSGVMTEADYQTAKTDADKLAYLMNEKRFVDIGLGFQENEDGKLIESSAFNEALNGLTFLGYGLDEDGDPKNIYSIVQRLKEIADSVPEEGKWSNEVYEEFRGMVLKLEKASSNFKTEFTNMDAGTQKLKNNMDLLDETAYNLDIHTSDLEDVNMAEAISSFIWAEYCYNAALKVGNSILSQSLMDYLQ